MLETVVLFAWAYAWGIAPLVAVMGAAALVTALMEDEDHQGTRL